MVPPFTGHVNPTVGVAAELVRRGHDVAWTGVPTVTEPLLPVGAEFWAATSPEVADQVTEMADRRPNLRGAAAFKFLQEEVLLPLGQTMVDGVDAAVDGFRPDVLVVDQQALAGAVVGRRRDLTWVTSATTSAELVDPLAALPKVAAAMHQARVDLQVAHGIDAEVANAGDLRLSPHLVIAYTSRALVGELEPGSVAAAVPIEFVGPSTHGRSEDDEFDWSWRDADRPLVLVSLGTLNADAGARFFGVAADACRDQPWQAVFVAPPELVPDPPANVVAFARVPQLAVLDRASAVVSHGGHNTVCEALAAGLPLVLAPIRDDQPVVADQVVQAGAGIRVRFNRVKAPELQQVIHQALTEEPLRSAAQRIATDFAEAGGASAAASALERLGT